jgi:T5SS/PEP-CTERM-associated repeat protein
MELVKRLSAHESLAQLLKLAMAVTASAFCAAPLNAASIDWLNAADGAFSDGASWDGGAAPSAIDAAEFSTGGADYTVTFSADAETASAVVNDQNVTWDLQGNTYTLSGAGGLDLSGRAMLNIQDGSFNTTELNIAAQADSYSYSGSSVTVDNGSLHADAVNIGLDGPQGEPGNLSILNGSTLTAGSIALTSGELLVDGAGSSLSAGGIGAALPVNFGFESTKVTIQNGATATIGGFFAGNGDSGVTLSITGGSSLDIEGSLSFARGSFGDSDRVVVSGGSTLTSETVFSGTEDFTNIKIDGFGSSWTNSGDLEWQSGGGIEITNNAVFLNQGAANIQSCCGSNFIVDGAGSKWTNGGDINFESNNSITLQVSNGGEVDATGQNITASGTTSLIKLDGGTIKAANVVLAGATLTGNGDIVGNVINGNGGFAGLISPGLSAGELNIDGDYVQNADAMLLMEIGGTVAGTEYDVLNISGTAFLDGALEIQLIDSYAPVFGDVFNLLTAEEINLDFNTLVLPELDGSLYWATSVVKIDLNRSAYQAKVVPIPASVWLFGSGLGMLLVWRRRRDRGLT